VSRWLAGLLLVVSVVCENAMELRNGSFERGWVGWMFSGAAMNMQRTDAPHGQWVLQCNFNGDMARQIVIAEPETRYAVSVWMRTENVKPVAGAGYAYAAIYEFDFQGNLLAAKDFAQLTGTNDWRRFEATWTTHPRTFYFEVRLGLYNADGVALFDAVQVAKGETTPAQYTEPIFAKGKIALILHDPNLPENPAAPSPKVLSNWLQQAGYEPQIVSFQQFNELMARLEARPSDAEHKVGLLVLPNSPYFPVEAHRNLLRLLSKGIDLLTFGGYAFDVPIKRAGDDYRPIRFGEPISATLLNSNPDFETVNPDGSAEGWERTNPQQCFVTSQVAKSGKSCAVVQIPEELKTGSAGWRANVKVQTGDKLRLSGWVKTEGVKGAGYAFLAYYPFAGDKWVNPRDIAQVRGDTDWQYFSATFVVPYGVDRVEIRFGIYNAVGKAFFDNVRLERVEMPPCINTRYGNPQDGLEISPLQIGMFDAHYPLRNAIQLEAKGWSWQVQGTQISGYSAVGVLRSVARWKPIVFARDRFGRICGTAGAMMHHYAGVFAGSTWVFFGVDNVDLTSLPGFGEKVLLPLLQSLRQGVFAYGLKSDLACYRPNETISAAVDVSNFGDNDFVGQVEFIVTKVPLEGSPQKWENAKEAVAEFKTKVAVGSGNIAAINARWEGLKLPEGLYRIATKLSDSKGNLIDEAEAGFFVWDGQSFPKKLNFRYADNYFWLNGNPTFLLGTDTWANWFFSPSQSDPLFWWRQIQAMKDAGLTVFENLQWTPTNYQFSEADWRKLDAMIWLCHRVGIVYMAGLLIGHDVAVDDATLERQAQFVAEFARRYKNADGLIYYLNGDYQLRPKTPEQNDLLWQVQQTRKWNERLVSTIKSVDPNHPVTSEYYQLPVGGLDLRLTIDGLDIANIGYFDEPSKDLRRFAAVFKLTDMRLYGKSLNIGEFGVKTHPAWERELGATGYHIRRTEEEQWRLMLLLPQYAFGLGASKVQNWCWRDDNDRVFPWGLVYPDDVPKPALKAYRTAALILHRLRPIWRKPEVLLVVSDNSRLRPNGSKVMHAALVAAQTLVSLRADFAVASDLALDDNLLENVKAVFLPGVLDLPTDAESALKRFAERGGIVYRSGTGGEKALEWDVTDFSKVDLSLRQRYRKTLDEAKVETIRTEPNLPTLHAFVVLLENGVAFVFVNASDQSVTFTAHLPSSHYASRIAMSLGAWQPGIVAVDNQGRVFLVEGSGRIFVNDELVAEGNGHFAVFADDNADIRDAKQLWLFPTEATKVTVHRRRNVPAFTTAEAREWQKGEWVTLKRTSIVSQPNAVVLEIDEDLRGETILLK